MKPTTWNIMLFVLLWLLVLYGTYTTHKLSKYKLELIDSTAYTICINVSVSQTKSLLPSLEDKESLTALIGRLENNMENCKQEAALKYNY
jgi:hypothetical protein